MAYQFSHRMDGVTGSAIRETFKLLARGDIISFAGGMPAASSFPSETLSEISQKLLRDRGAVMLQYGQTEGYAPLYDSIAQVVAPRGIRISSPAQMQILTGSSQGIELFTKAMIDPGDVIVAERPTFLGALQTFASYQAKVVGVDTDDDGILIDHLEELVKEYHPKFLYTIPTFQNPGGMCLSLERRKKIAELSARYGFLVLEDDPYCELRYEGEVLPSIKSFDESDTVVHLMSFSKTVSPGMRLGAAIGNETIIRKMAILKQGMDVHTPILTQAMVDEYIRQGYYFKHVQDVLPSYREQLSAMINGFESFPAGVSYSRPSGGLFIWATLPEGLDATPLLAQAADRGVAYIPGIHFYAENGKANTMRLNFSACTPEQISRGMHLLGELLREQQ